MHHKTITYMEPRGKRERQKFTDIVRTKMGLQGRRPAELTTRKRKQKILVYGLGMAISEVHKQLGHYL